MRGRRGRFIVIEGPDGAGKTTQAEMLCRELAGRGLDVLLVREPGGTAVGEKIRRILLDRRTDNLTPLAEAFLFQAARAQLVDEIIRPALGRGTWVIADRFSASTYVYQGCAGGVPAAEIERMSGLATGGLWPDCYLILAVSEREAEARKRRAGRRKDRMEARPAAFRRKVFEGYREFARRHAGRVAVVDASGSPGETFRKVLEALDHALG
ncbi:MAG: dTMP kinase [Planctomycetota bacterium]|nr:dTMP kinase [Planctomycetota bacterium]